MLQRQRGIVWSRSTYPDGTVVIKFDPEKLTDGSLQAFIAEMGFTVAEARPRIELLLLKLNGGLGRNNLADL